MVSLGLDISATCTGIVLLDGDHVDVMLGFKPKKLTGMARAQAIADTVLDLVQAHKPRAIAIEGYGFASQSLATSVEVGAVVRFCLHLAEHRWIEVAPNALKKYATGKGNAGKEVVTKEVYKRWGFDTNSHDIADAYVLARIAQARVLGMPPGTPAFQKEVLGTLKVL